MNKEHKSLGKGRVLLGEPEVSLLSRLCNNRIWLEILFATIATIGFVRHFYSLYDSMYVVNHGLPQELREGVGVKLAVEFAKGNNPYSIVYNEQNAPVINHYGFFSSLFLSWCIRFLGLFTPARPIIICTLVTLLVIALGCVSFGGAIYKRTSNIFFAAIATETSLSCYWRLGFNGGSFPDFYGLTMSFALLFFVESDIKRQKYRYPLYILLVLLMFYTKQYFLLCGLGILVWLVNTDKKTAQKYMIFGLASGVISVIIINNIFPLYFTESVFLSGTTNLSSHSIKYAIEQFQYSFNRYMPLFIVIISFVVSLSLSKLSILKKVESGLFKEILSHVAKYDVIMMILGTLACIRMGQNGGARHSYFLQLWIPYVISVSCFCAHIIAKKTSGMQYTYIITMILLLSVPKTCSDFYKTNALNEDIIQNWKDVYEILDEYSKGDGDKILYCTPFSFYAIDRDYEAIDYGTNMYVRYGLIDDSNPLLKQYVFPRADWLINRVEEVRSEARDKIINKGYNCLVLMEGNHNEVSREWIENTDAYELYMETEIKTGGQWWDIYIYLPSK